MGSDVVADMYAYGADFSSARPDTRVACQPVTLDTQSQQRLDDSLLQFPDIFTHTKTVFSKVKDGIAYKLSRTMIGNTSPAIGAKNGDSFPSQYLRWNKYILSPLEPPYGENRWVLQEKYYVTNLALSSCLLQLLLQIQGNLIWHHPQVGGNAGLLGRSDSHQ